MMKKNKIINPQYIFKEFETYNKLIIKKELIMLENDKFLILEITGLPPIQRNIETKKRSCSFKLPKNKITIEKCRKNNWDYQIKIPKHYILKEVNFQENKRKGEGTSVGWYKEDIEKVFDYIKDWKPTEKINFLGVTC